VRVATFNVENLDEDIVDDDGVIQGPTLEERIKVLRPQLLRLNADILCLQEVHGQETENQPRTLKTLAKLLEETPFSEFHIKYLNP
jgi:exonuclease III